MMKKVLIAEKSNIMQHFLEKCLISEGFCIRLAVNGRELDNYLKYENIELLIMDAMFPDQRITDAVSEIRDQYPDIRILIMSRAFSLRDIVKLIRAGADDCIIKPVSEREMSYSIRYVFSEQPASARKLRQETAHEDVKEEQGIPVSSKDENRSDRMLTAHGSFDEPDCSSDSFSLHEYLKKREYEVIAQAMKKFRNDQKSVAAYLGISDRSLRYKLKEMKERDTS